MYLLDTNICIFLMRDQYPELTAKVLSLDPSQLYISSVTVFELKYGVAKSVHPEKNRLQEESAGSFRRKARLSGPTIFRSLLKECPGI